MGTEGSGATRAGGDRIHNEDAFLVEEGLGLYVVCDGVSGRPAGEVAARLAVGALEDFVARAEDQSDVRFREGSFTTAFVERAVRFAMDSVIAAAEEDAELRGMATTATMLLVHGREGVVGHVGDSRAALIRAGRLHALTVDHELTEELSWEGAGSEAETGSGPEIDTFSIALHPGDTILLCTDGAEDALLDLTLVRSAASLSPRLLASRIVSAAHRRDPECDATVVVVRVRRDDEPAWLSVSVPPREASFGHVVAFK
jgi:protein phosphatase